MKILGVDFTSAPKRDKSIVAAVCSLEHELRVDQILEFSDWPAYELWLGSADRWIGGFDFPFGLPKRFVERQGWPLDWPGMVKACVGGCLLTPFTYKRIVAALAEGAHPLGLRVRLPEALKRRAHADSSGDVLDALLCSVQAAWASRQENFGLPADVVPCEGWIVTAR